MLPQWALLLDDAGTQLCTASVDNSSAVQIRRVQSVVQQGLSLNTLMKNPVIRHEAAFTCGQTAARFATTWAVMRDMHTQ